MKVVNKKIKKMALNLRRKNKEENINMKNWMQTKCELSK